MTIPYTGVTFLFGSFVFFFLARRFRQVYKKELNFVARNFSLSFFCFGLRYSIAGALSLFLVQEQTIWRIFNPIQNFFTFFGLVLLSHTIVKVRLLRFGFIYTLFISILSALFLVLIILYPPLYYFENGFLAWKPGLAVGLIGSLVIFLVIIPLGVTFLQMARKTDDRVVKIRSLGIGLAAFWLILPVILDYFIINILKLDVRYSELNYFILFLILLITIFLTYRPHPAGALSSRQTRVP